MQLKSNIVDVMAAISCLYSSIVNIHKDNLLKEAQHKFETEGTYHGWMWKKFRPRYASVAEAYEELWAKKNKIADLPYGKQVLYCVSRRSALQFAASKGQTKITLEDSDFGNLQDYWQKSAVQTADKDTK